MIEEYFGFKYREGDIDVSLSSFSENELPALSLTQTVRDNEDE